MGVLGQVMTMLLPTQTFQRQPKTGFLWSGALLLTLIVGAWFALPKKVTVPQVSLGLTSTGASGSEVVYGALVTNQAACRIRLDPPLVQYEDGNGRILTRLADLWNEKDTVTTLSP